VPAEHFSRCRGNVDSTHARDCRTWSPLFTREDRVFEGIETAIRIAFNQRGLAASVSPAVAGHRLLFR
jgi:hypothetical protein